MPHELVPYILGILLLVTGRHFLKKNDELPIFLVVFNILVEGRIFALKNGYAEWIRFDYGIRFDFSMESAYTVSGLICLGTLVMVTTYLLLYKDQREIKKRDTAELFKAFIAKNKMRIVVGFFVFFLFQMVLGASLSKGYSFLLTLATTSFIILLFLLVYYTRTSMGEKIVFGIFFLVLAVGTYGAGLRFQFLGWLIPIAVFLTRKMTPRSKMILFGSSAFYIIVLFSVAGVIRGSYTLKDDVSMLYDAAIGRMLAFEDVNFIDGFMMVHQVYPEHLDYHYGIDHLGIIARPVPRTWWPGKPHGGWHQKFAAKYDLGYEFSTGISPTIFGVFYGEGGKWGIVIFSVVWAWMFWKIKSYTANFDVGLEYLLKGVLIAALVPIYRSGDLAGDVAIVGMSFWPLFLFIYQYNKFIKTQPVTSSTHGEGESTEMEVKNNLPAHHADNPFVINKN